MTIAKPNAASLNRRFFRWVVIFVVGVLVIAAFRWSVLDWNDVPTGSMLPTIVEGDQICVNKLAYDLKAPFTSARLATWSQPRRGDVVVLLSPRDGKQLVKRIVLAPGDLSESGMRVPPGRYFVEGDNRRHSVDSRSFGYVDRIQIIGRVVCVLASCDPEHRLIPRPGRFFKRID